MPYLQDIKHFFLSILFSASLTKIPLFIGFVKQLISYIYIQTRTFLDMKRLH